MLRCFWLLHGLLGRSLMRGRIAGWLSCHWGLSALLPSRHWGCSAKLDAFLI